MARRKAGDIEEVEIQKDLMFTLTRDELAGKGQEAAKLAQELGETQRKAELEKKMWKGKIESKQWELDNTLDIIRAGEEERRVMCIMRKDYDRMLVEYVFNGEIMETRAMTIDERQTELRPLGGDATDDAKESSLN